MICSTIIPWTLWISAYLFCAVIISIIARFVAVKINHYQEEVVFTFFFLF